MEVDDDFGDLYSDVLLPVPSEPAKPPPPNPNSNPIRSSPATTAPAAVSAPSGGRRTDEDDDWLLGGGASPTVDPTSNWADDDDELNTKPKQNENPRVSVSSPDRKIPGDSTAVGPDAADQDEPRTSIPGLDAAVGPTADDDWDDDSDSEDDLKIVLNDTEHRAMDEMMYGEEEADEEGDLVIVTHDDQTGDLNQDWGEEGGPGPAGEEGKEGDKGAGVGTAGTPGPGRAGYSSFHPSHHSTYKYVRPGAPGGGPGAQGQQVRPPLPGGPYPGRGGRAGDWRPAGGFRGGFNNNAWGSQNRPVGLDFSLPPQKTIFDFDIDSFEEKPWKHPGADLSDFFNFGMDEEKWKDYCKSLSQLKIESTMQSRIRVYESGRSEPEFDPDLPPELAAATGQNEMISDGGSHNMRSNGQADFNNNINNNNSQGAGTMRPQLPTGRAILVESSYAERLPSMDTRPPRLRESDTIIEIVLQDSFGGDYENGDVADKKERESQEDNENDDFAPESYRHRERSPRRESSHRRRYSPSSNSSSSEDSYKSSPKQKEILKEKEEATQEATQDAATQDPSNDDQSEQLVYSEPEQEEVNSVDQEQEESQSQGQSQSQSQSQSQRENSVREREESRQRAATRRSHSRSERDDDVAPPQDRLLLPKSNRPLRKDHMRVNNFNSNHHYNNNNNNNLKWRGNGDDVYYHQQHHHQPAYMHREREFAPHHHNQHGFRGRSFDNNNMFNNRGFREEEDEMRMDIRGGVGRKGLRGVYEREDVGEGFRVRKREKDDGFIDNHVKRRRDEEIYNPRRERGKVVEREDAVMMMERKREREREREREERESSGHGIRVNTKDSKRYREREERERLKSKQQIHEREDLRAVSRNNNRHVPTSRDEAKTEERERERKPRDKLLLNNNNNINNNNNSRHDKDKYRDRRSGRTDTSTDKRKHEGHKVGEQENSKKILEASHSDEDPDSDSRRGRSKLERWTSHKERDWTSPVQTAEPKLLEVSSSNANGEDHLDPAERLKRRSERFKLPLHGDKEREKEERFKLPLHGEKEREKEEGGEGELTGQSQSQQEVKSERPARKRRWTGS